MIALKVERSMREFAAGSASLIQVDPALMEAHQLKAGGLVRVATFWRELWGRLGAPEEADRNTGLIRLDRLQRQTLKARLHERVEINREEERAATRVHLQPAVDLALASPHHIEEHLKEELVHHRAPLTKGRILFINFHHSSAGTLFKVAEVESGGAGVVTEETDLILDPPPEGFANEVGLDVTFEDLGGLDREIRLVQELFELPLKFPGVFRQVGIQPPRGVIFYGPPGTGKTRLVRAMTNEVDAQFYYINGPEIIGSTYGESEGNLRKIFSEAAHHAPSVIFIDEIDVIGPKRGETGSHTDTRMVSQLLSCMDGINSVDGVVVVGTTNRLNSLDIALRRPGRFDRELYIGPPNETGRLQILKIHTREMPLSGAALEYLPEVAYNTHGFVGADLMELCREAGLNALRRHVQDLTSGRDLSQFNPENIRVECEDLQAARAQTRPSASRETLVAIPNKGFDMVGGLTAAKKQITELVVDPLRTGNGFSRDGYLLHDGLLISGPSGTGKSLFVEAVAKESGVNFININGPELFTKWLGESEEALRDAFQLARQLAPCIIFFDQLDALAPIRNLNSGSRTTERVVSQLLGELDDLEHDGRNVVMAATNRIDLVDPSLLQPGRFGTHIYFRLPDRQERAEILGIFLRSMGLADTMDEAVKQELAGLTEGSTGAQLRALVTRLYRENARTGPGKLSGLDLKSLIHSGPESMSSPA
ncbi:MAG: AAA family ATPase [Desulfobacterales bacterium]|nr:AAA family ATPase [Desulfobacterales bacterium]